MKVPMGGLVIENGDTPAAPTKHDSEHFEHSHRYSTGLTKREKFAAMAMQGILSNGGTQRGNEKYQSESAVAMADTLLEALNNDKVAS